MKIAKSSLELRSQEHRQGRCPEVFSEMSRAKVVASFHGGSAKPVRAKEKSRINVR